MLVWALWCCASMSGCCFAGGVRLTPAWVAGQLSARLCSYAWLDCRLFLVCCSHLPALCVWQWFVVHAFGVVLSVLYMLLAL
jgi:hypothetical protein